MKVALPLVALGAMFVAAPAAANHIFTPTAFDSRGECEAENARLSNDDAVRQFPLRPDLFSSLGEARSFLTRAFTCEYDNEDEAWYLVDHRRDVLGSEWFLRRKG